MIFDVIAAFDAPLHYPVPSAREPETSFLATANQMHRLLTEQGFRPISWVDSTQAGIAWFAERQKGGTPLSTPSVLGLHRAMGPGFGEMTANLAWNRIFPTSGIQEHSMSVANRYWFPAKRYGWGWGFPSRWQGWVVLVVYIVLMCLDTRFFRPDREPFIFALFVVLLSAALLAVCWLKGEPPRWRWGKD